jgi:hypothetical protein
MGRKIRSLLAICDGENGQEKALKSLESLIKKSKNLSIIILKGKGTKSINKMFAIP